MKDYFPMDGGKLKKIGIKREKDMCFINYAFLKQNLDAKITSF